MGLGVNAESVPGTIRRKCNSVGRATASRGPLIHLVPRTQPERDYDKHASMAMHPSARVNEREVQLKSLPIPKRCLRANRGDDPYSRVLLAVATGRLCLTSLRVCTTRVARRICSLGGRFKGVRTSLKESK